MDASIEIVIAADAQALAEKALQLLGQAAEATLQAQRYFTLAVAGGSTPALLYRLLGQSGWDFSRWRIVYGDERFLADGDSERNSSLLEKTWLNHLVTPLAAHYKVHFAADFAQVVEEYGEAVGACLPLDFALLGMGEDGHTASLFPQKHYADSVAVMVDDAPKAPSRRMSLSYASLNSAKTVCFLVTGATKVAALAKWQQGESLPVAQILGKDKTYLLLDTAAACLIQAR